MNIVPFKLKQTIGKLSSGPGRLLYDREKEVICFTPNFYGDDAQLIAEPDSASSIELPQKAISRIHFRKALLFGGGTLVIRLRNGKKSEYFPIFGVEEIELAIHKRDVADIEELIKEVKFDLFDDTLDDMLSDVDDTLGY